MKRPMLWLRTACLCLVLGGQCAPPLELEDPEDSDQPPPPIVGQPGAPPPGGQEPPDPGSPPPDPPYDPVPPPAPPPDPAPPPTGDCDPGVDLNGYWIDHGSVDRQVQVTHIGSTVFATYVDEPFVCDHRDDAGTTSETSQSFSGTMSGCEITGTLTTCVFGMDEDDGENGDAEHPRHPNGITPAPFTAAVNFEGDRIEGTYTSIFGDERSFHFTRLDCRRKTALDYGLNGERDWTRTDEAESQILYQAPAAPGSPSLTVMAGVSGTVEAIFPFPDDGLALQVFVATPGGKSLAYNFYGENATPLVSVGDAVGPTSFIGNLEVQASTSSYTFRVVGFVAGTEERINPDCVEEPL
jgi:hypothetical protein